MWCPHQDTTGRTCLFPTLFFMFDYVDWTQAHCYFMKSCCYFIFFISLFSLSLFKTQRRLRAVVRNVVIADDGRRSAVEGEKREMKREREMRRPPTVDRLQSSAMTTSRTTARKCLCVSKREREKRGGKGETRGEKRRMLKHAKTC